MKVPNIVEPAPKATAPIAIQYTLSEEAPFVKIIDDPAAAANAPPILNIKTASASPCPSNVKAPVSVAAEPAAYIPGSRVSPFP